MQPWHQNNWPKWKHQFQMLLPTHEHLGAEKLSTVSYIKTLLDEFDDVKGTKFFSLTHGGTVIEICGASGSGKTIMW